MQVFMGPDFSEKKKQTNKQTNKIGNNVPSLCKMICKKCEGNRKYSVV